MKLTKATIILLVFYLIMCTSCGSPKNEYYDIPSKKLSDSIETIEVQFIAYACYYPRWIFTKDSLIADSLNLQIHVEAASDSIQIPNNLFYNRNTFLLTGQFYKEEQLGDQEENDHGLAKCFQYTSWKLIDTAGIWKKESP